MRLPILLRAGALVALLSPSSCATLETRRDEIDTQTTFYIRKCNATETSKIEQAQKDALKLADAALDDAREILATDHSGGKYINFETQATIEYFGPSSKSAPMGFQHWWNDRRVEVHCDDILKSIKGEVGCVEGVVAYTFSDNTNLYPYIVYCPRFFFGLKSHQEAVNAIKADSTGQMKLNVRNLRSRATTTLHEWLHIKPPFTAEVCHKGCNDWPQNIGGEFTATYKAGASKLLARRVPALAYRNNDNYVYFAASRWMQKNLGAYPEYPTAWDPKLTPDQNSALDALEPGYPQDAQTLETEDWTEDLEGGNEDGEAVSVEPLPASVYPEWYQPVISAVRSTTLPDIEVPKETQIALSEPDFNDVVCESSDGSPFIDDCIHAFGVMNLFPDSPVLQGRKGGTEWVGYVHSCALAVYYEEDWTDGCNATLRDVQGHASAIFVGCRDGKLGTVGGHVPLAIPECPASIEIIHTDGKPPQGAIDVAAFFTDLSHKKSSPNVTALSVLWRGKT